MDTSDWINSMDHMRIVGIESSSAILHQKKYGKRHKKCQKKLKAKGWCYNPQN